MKKKPTSQKQPGTARERVRKAGRKAEEAAQPEHAAPGAPVQFSPELERFVQFMRSLPLTPEPVEWVETFRDALIKLLGDVDRITINVNVYCNLVAPRDADVVIEIAQIFLPGKNGIRRHTTVQTVYTGSPSERVLSQAQHAGITLAEYQSPHCFDYRYKGIQNIGAILLFRLRTNPPISERSLELMRVLEPFLIYVFSNLVARYTNARPVSHRFAEIMHAIWMRYALTPREMEVLLLHGSGMVHEQIADRLFISQDAVKKRMKNVYRKTGCSSFLELFGRYIVEEETRAPSMPAMQKDGTVLVF